MSHQVATTVRSFCFGLYCSAFLSNCEKYWEFLKRNLKAKLFIKGCLKPEVPTSRLRTSTSSHFSFRELSSAVYSAKVRRRDWLGEGGGCAGGGRGGGRERESALIPTFISDTSMVLTARSLGWGPWVFSTASPPTRRKIVFDNHGSLVNICQVNS